MAGEPLAIFAEGPGDGEEPDERAGGMEVEGHRRRAGAGQRHRAEKPDRNAGQENAGEKRDCGQYEGQAPPPGGCGAHGPADERGSAWR